MRRYIFITIAALALLVIYKLVRYLSDHGVVNLNELSIHAGAPLKVDRVKVVQGVFSINRKNDSELFYNWRDDHVIFNGASKHNPETGHGENGFLILYDNTYYFQFTHFQTDERENNAFDFYLSQVDTLVYLEVKIDKGMSFRRRMNRIDHSKFQLTNRPLDSLKGGIYNGIELR